MKKTYLLVVFFNLFGATSLSQVTIVVNGLNYPQRLLLIDNILYFSHDDTVSYIDITVTNPTPTILISNLNEPTGLEFKDDFLYIAQFQSGDIVKVYLNSPTPSTINVVNYGGTPNMLKFIGNDLYITDNNDNRIYKYDVTSALIAPEVILNNNTDTNGPLGLAFKDDYLYYNIPLLGSVYKFDINAPSSDPIEVVSSLNHPLGMEFKNDELYIADIEDGLIVKIDFAQSPANIVTILTNVNRPTDITFDGNIMYFLDLNSISKVAISTLNIDEFAQDKIQLYPNPTKDYLKVSNLKDDIEITIYDLNGQSLKQEIVSPNEQINIYDLNVGIYFIHFKGKSNLTKKFIKN